MPSARVEEVRAWDIKLLAAPPTRKDADRDVAMLIEAARSLYLELLDAFEVHIAHTVSMSIDRGRDAHYCAPPAQNRTGGFPAYGSHLGCLTAKRTRGHG